MAKYTSVQNKLDLANNVEMDGDVQLPDSHWRMCYRRAHEDWRLRNEENGDLYHVLNYEGDFNMNWFDGHSHFFHDGPIFMDKDHVAHLENPVDKALADSYNRD